MKYGNLNFLEPSGPLQACNGTALPLSTFYMISRRILLRMRYISDKSCTGNHTILRSVIVFFEYRAVYEIMWKNILGRRKSQMLPWRVRFAFWIPKAINTHSEYVIFIAFPLQQLLHERTSVLYVLRTRVSKKLSALLFFPIYLHKCRPEQVRHFCT